MEVSPSPKRGWEGYPGEHSQSLHTHSTTEHPGRRRMEQAQTPWGRRRLAPGPTAVWPSGPRPSPALVQGMEAATPGHLHSAYADALSTTVHTRVLETCSHVERLPVQTSFKPYPLFGRPLRACSAGRGCHRGDSSACTDTPHCSSQVGGTYTRFPAGGGWHSDPSRHRLAARKGC